MPAKKTSSLTPLILRALRLMDAFAKSDDERDFYLDRKEGAILFVDLSKSTEDLDKLYAELNADPDRYCLLPKLSFYETKKIMEGFVGEKVYDIDTKEKLMDIIQSKDAREQFLEFVYDHDAELEKWHQYYQERSRVRIIEWLRAQNFHFVFEEDLEVPHPLVEKLKLHLFDSKVPKDVSQARQTLEAKAKTYYSNEALNPRPKRGRPPKQVAKVEVETFVSSDIYTTLPQPVRRFLFIPDITSPSSITFSEKYDTEEEFIAHIRGSHRPEGESQLEALSKKFASLQQLSDRLAGVESDLMPNINFNEKDEDEVDDPTPKKRRKRT